MEDNTITIPLNEYNRLTDAAAKVDKLADTNGALCAEINRQERVIEELRKLVNDLYWLCIGYAVDQRCDLDRWESIERRMSVLGVVVDK